PQRRRSQFDTERSQDMLRSLHQHDRNPGGANSVSNAIRLGNHPGHCADTYQTDVLVADELRNFVFVHRLGVAIDQKNFMVRRSERLEQKHPEVRHEIAGYAVVRAVKQNSHGTPSRDRLLWDGPITTPGERASVFTYML